jgi:biotin transporter BioY
MAANPKNKLNLLAIIGGIALMLVAWRFPVPLGFASIGLTSLLAVVLGSLTGYKSGLTITIGYVFLYVVGLPELLWYHAAAPATPLLTTPTAGLVFGLPVAALVAALMAPFGRGTIGRVFTTGFAGLGVWLLCGGLWMAHIASPILAFQEISRVYLLPAIIKAGAAGAAIISLRKLIK